ncbi:sulfite exporter TauE/SafE family protein [Natronorubrum aibiense]|uniref:Probable membrane transporter protein n=1 Tax=Natronorubrum aibiense TaxID=348826 RepID=A0A5P9P4S7_9EURY|nr:sulfite exporter TauE/SafE family protein [Natronorubrum aibiense]QFU83159.1 TSUP family transporter [Natronorubrum aibiense]
MALLGLSLELLAVFIGFGFMVGVFFGFFGMGGSFLVTPALLILGYPAPVAIGSSMAFVFGTAVIATLKHHDVGQVDYKLGALMFVGIVLGIEGGKAIVFFLETLGRAELVVGVAYVLLLAAIGLLFVRSALNGSDDDADDAEADEIPELAQTIKSYNIPPMVTLTDGSKASMWTISGVGGGVGLVSGFLGVGGGFLRMPAIYYLIGVPLSAAVGTSLFGALMSGAVGAFSYGLSGVIDIGVVTALLIGSALGARIGSAATAYVDENDVTIYFGIMLLLASTAVAFGELATWLERPVLDTVSFVLLVGSSLFVTVVIFYYGIRAIRTADDHLSATAGGDD